MATSSQYLLLTEDDDLTSYSPDSHPILNVVLVGRTGNGKSASGNTITRSKMFLSKNSASGVTMKCQTHRVLTPAGPILNVIDTPGLFDLSVSREFITTEIVNCLGLASGGINAVLLVLSVRTRISEEEQNTLSILQVLFGSRILDYLIVVFTGADDLEDSGTTLKEYLADCPKFLKELLILCGGRKVLFDNKTKDDVTKDKQVGELMSLVKQVGIQNKGEPYTNEMYHKIKLETDQHMAKQRELETKGFSGELLPVLLKELQQSHDQNLQTMAAMMARTLKEAGEAQERLFQRLQGQNRQPLLPCNML